MYKVIDGPIDDIALESAVRTEADGAVIVFRGVARRFSRGRDVVHLEYEAYPEMAEKVMQQIGDEIKARRPGLCSTCSLASLAAGSAATLRSIRGLAANSVCAGRTAVSKGASSSTRQIASPDSAGTWRAIACLKPWWWCALPKTTRRGRC